MCVCVCVTCDQHRSVLHRQQLRPSVGDPDQDGAAAQQEKLVDHWRNHPKQRSHECGGAHLRRAAASERPGRNAGEEQPGGHAETSSGFHLHTAEVPSLLHSAFLAHGSSGMPPNLFLHWLGPACTWASPVFMMPYLSSTTFLPQLPALLLP